MRWNTSVRPGLSSFLVLSFLLLGAPALAQSHPPPWELSEALPQINNSLLHQQIQITAKETLAIGCNPHHRLASWVVFPLTKQSLDVTPRFKRWTGKYVTDTELFGDCLIYHDEYKAYNDAGYDRGHLADAESFNGSAIGNREVAFTSNLAPQNRSFNRGIWAKLEAWQRQQARNEEEVMVIVGPVLTPQLPHLGGGISIPEEYYKIIIDMTPPMKAIGFLISQTDRGDFTKHWVCPAEIEAKTGLKFADKWLGPDKAALFEDCNFKDWH